MKPYKLLPASRDGVRGFTLIELMVAVAVFAILAAVAYPSYQQYVRKAARSEAKAVLMETAQYMERYYTTNNTYVGATVATVSNKSPKGATGSAIRYNISFTADPTAGAFTLQAVPANGQVSDSCGTLTLAHTGATTPTTVGCW